MESSGGSAPAGSVSDRDEGDQDETSSLPNSKEILETLEKLTIDSATPKPEAIEDELFAFRQQWQRELESTPSPKRDLQSKEESTEELSEEDKAKHLFLRGVELERSGKLYEAIQHYKRAMQIVPDVETKLYESSDIKQEAVEDDVEVEEDLNVNESTPSDDEDVIEGEDLLTRLNRITSRKGYMCEPAFPTKTGHLSWLPYEVLLTIFRWVIGSEHDALSLERVSRVSRGLYLATRDQDLWRTLCVKTWGIECGTPRASGFATWRDMYIDRPRLHLHGCYISKTTYIRHGENSFQDLFYRPWYLIEYYRYLRFFSDGTVLMWTTSEEPTSCVQHLKNANSTKTNLGIMGGHYRFLKDNKVAIVIKKCNTEKKPAQSSNTRFRSRRKETVEQHDHIYHLELELRKFRHRRNAQLCWVSHSVSTRKDQWSHFDLTSSKYPPFAFCTVRSYTAESQAPLRTTHAYN